MDGESSSYNKVENVYVSHVEDAVTFWGQSFNRIQEISKISESLATVCPTMSPVFGIPNLDKVYGGMFSADKCWYRCKLQHVVDDEQCAVTYIDYGNSEILNRTSIVELPEDLQMHPVAQKFRLWGLQLHTSSDIEQGLQFLSKLIADQQISVQQKTVYKDGTIVVQVLHDNLDIGEEVVRKGFAEKCKLLSSQSNSRETREVVANHEQSRFSWPVKIVERLPMREPKTLPLLNRGISEQKASDQQGNNGKNNFQAERNSSELNGLKIDQRCLDENKLLKVENKQLRDEKESLMQKLRKLEIHLQKMHLDMKKARELSEKTIHGLEFTLKTAAGSRLKVLTTKINGLRTLRCDNECMSVADDLLEAVKVVTEKPLSAPSTLKNLEDNWKEYHLAQEMIQDCNDVVDLDLLIDKRNKIQKTLSSSIDDFIVEVEQMPLDERLTKLETLKHSLKTIYGTSVDCEDSDSVFQEFYDWKQARLMTFNSLRNDTNSSLGVIGTWFSDVQKLFDLASTESLVSSDNVDGIDSIIEKVDTNVSMELEVSLKEPNQKEQEIIKNTYNRVVKLINEEICLIEAVSSKFLSSVEFKNNIVQWINTNPNVDDLMEVKKTIKGLKGQLRWKLLESSNMEESDEYNETTHKELKSEIDALRTKIFYEIQREQEEYVQLSIMVQKWFPELPLMYSDAGILNHMCSGGLLSSSMERILFDAEPMKELSNKRPLLCTEIQDKKVLLKGYSVGADTEEQVIVRAAEFHKAWMLQKEESGIMELLYLFFCKSDPMVYLMVPFYAGESLGTVQTLNPLNSYEIVKVMSGIAQGMQTLHAANIIIGSLHENNMFVINRERGIIGDLDFTRDAEQRSSATMVCFPLWTAPEVKAGRTASAATDVYSYGMTLLWLCIATKDIPTNPDGTPDLNRIDVDLKAKSLLSRLLCCDDRMEAKQIQTHDYFQIAEVDNTAEADNTVLPDEAFNENVPADFA
ncbi:serine/threonine-protein kinase 31 [Aquarana catesbeiana]|uniref:serine/threonine-protein kinase 31 n=1 Tax=Aquarana catesbeiana TaxID=8400 RepID=UPI003CC9BFAE